MFSFNKEERLCNQKQIELLVKTSDSFLVYPIKVGYVLTTDLSQKPHIFLNFPAKVLITVSKRRYKHAHDRNRLKRLLREAYRLQKNGLYDALKQKNMGILIQFSYIAKEEQPFLEIKARAAKCFLKLTQIVEATTTDL